MKRRWIVSELFLTLWNYFNMGPRTLPSLDYHKIDIQEKAWQKKHARGRGGLGHFIYL
jgi:hypothetical protein